MTQKTKTQIVRDYINKMHATYIMYYGVELGLFKAINELEKPFTVEALAKKMGYHAPFVGRWCYAAYAIDILDYVDNDTFSISDEWLDLFLNEESCSYGAYLPKCHIKIADYLSWVPDSIKTGKKYNFDSTDDEFIEAVEKDGIRFTNCLLKNIIPQLSEFDSILNIGATLLDIGCGSANNLITFAKHYPKTKLIGVDISKKSVRRANENIKKNGLEARITIHQGCASDFIVDGSIDVVTFIESLHEIDASVRETIFKNCNKLLSDNGIVMIIDCISPEDRAELNKPEYEMAALVDWFEMTWGSTVPTRKEINDMLDRNGFSKLQEVPVVDAVIAGISRRI